MKNHKGKINFILVVISIIVIISLPIVINKTKKHNSLCDTAVEYMSDGYTAYVDGEELTTEEKAELAGDLTIYAYQDIEINEEEKTVHFSDMEMSYMLWNYYPYIVLAIYAILFLFSILFMA